MPLPSEDLDHVLAHTRVLWNEARERCFFLTGGTGFFGMWLLESFARVNDALELNAKAVVLTRDTVAFARKAPHLAGRKDISFIQGDVRSFEFPEGHFDYVIHAATEASAKLNSEAPDEMLDVIVGGTRRVLQFAKEARIKKFLLTSSGAVYGYQPRDLTHISEQYRGGPDPLSPESAYGIGKSISEHLCAVHALQQHYEMKIARCFAFVGPHLPLDAHFAVGNFIRDAMQGNAVRIGGDGSPMRSYLYASDLAVWLWTVLFRGESHRAYNVGSPDDISIEELGRTVASLVTPQVDVVIAKPKVDDLLPLRYVPDVARVGRELSLFSRITLREAILKTISWHREADKLL